MGASRDERGLNYQGRPQCWKYRWQEHKKEKGEPALLWSIHNFCPIDLQLISAIICSIDLPPKATQNHGLFAVSPIYYYYYSI
jgi:hypothetical protein